MANNSGAANLAEARKWAGFYQSRGLCPLPSDPTPDDGRKKPLCRYRDFFEAPAPGDLFEQFPTSNIQVITGRFWRLLVIDCDGQAGADWLFSLDRPIPKTWAVRSGGGGLHLWFRLPENYAKPLPKGFLWKGDGKHEAVERLCDRSLAMAPPSIHPVSGKRYVWANDARFLPPTKLPLPADCPRWLLDLKPIERERSTLVITPPQDGASRLESPIRGRYRVADVLDAIPDKIALAASWGLRFEGRRTQDGWWPAHAFDRPDDVASAAVHEDTGFYTDLGSGTRFKLFDLAVALGQSGDWQEAVEALGGRFRARERRAS